MGHQYRVSALSDELGMRRIFPIVLIRGIRVPRLDTLFNHQGVRPEEPEAVEESEERPVSSGSNQVRRSSSRIAHTRRSRRNKRALPSQPLRRSPRLNKGTRKTELKRVIRSCAGRICAGADVMQRSSKLTPGHYKIPMVTEQQIGVPQL